MTIITTLLLTVSIASAIAAPQLTLAVLLVGSVLTAVAVAGVVAWDALV